MTRQQRAGGPALGDGPARRRVVVAIDGPAGAGKSTVARRVAAGAGLRYLDTGAMYRAVTWACLQAGIDLMAEPLGAAAVVAVAETTDITFVSGSAGDAVRVNGVDPGEALRAPAVDRGVARVATLAGVRRALVPQQRRQAQGGGLVLDGRDIGTDVLPDADVKVFLTADAEARAARRHAELRRRAPNVRLAEVRRDLQDRDALDQKRQESPLRRAPDAHVIDTTHLSVDQVVERILALLPRAQGEGSAN